MRGTAAGEPDRDLIWEDRTITLKLLFDPEHHLEERILKEQFVP